MPIKNRNMAVDIQLGLTGTGSNQTITHKLGVIPTFVDITETSSPASRSYVVSKGSKSCVVNVPNGVTFDIKFEA